MRSRCATPAPWIARKAAAIAAGPSSADLRNGPERRTASSRLGPSTYPVTR
ncbi:hypothetical protein [Nonomuraea sp. SBT364]|uniref:hypothetical protein n=1 Tax=Nonomuraea sp. SBT364 TaxID=1580530 RepID=UPI0018CDA69B|nr:hypothetical protein [Nonomuraea sp. SBT364]